MSVCNVGGKELATFGWIMANADTDPRGNERGAVSHESTATPAKYSSERRLYADHRQFVIHTLIGPGAAISEVAS